MVNFLSVKFPPTFRFILELVSHVLVTLGHSKKTAKAVTKFVHAAIGVESTYGVNIQEKS